MNHFTNRKGWNAIRARSPWRFRAGKPPGDRPVGAYFTPLDRSARNFSRITRIPAAKQEYVFSFLDVGDLRPLPGPRGRYVLYSPTDYLVAAFRQRYEGRA